VATDEKRDGVPKGAEAAVDRPRLRKKGKGKDGEVPVPAYAAMPTAPRWRRRWGCRGRASVGKPSRPAKEELRRWCERRCDEVELLILDVDGIIFGDHTGVGAVGVDAEGKKHVRGLAEGAREDQVVVRRLLENLVERGLKTERRYLLVIDGSKALGAAMDAVLGPRAGGAAVPSAQDREWGELSVRRVERSGPGGDAGGLSGTGEGRDGQA